MKLRILRNLLAITAAYAAFFALERLIFFLVFRDASYPVFDTAKAFLIGARLDISLAATLCGPVYVALAAAATLINRESPFNRLAFAYFAVINCLFAILTVAGFPFYSEYSSRLNHLFFEYLNRPKELIVTLSGVISLLPMGLALAALCYGGVKAAAITARHGFSRLKEERLPAKLAAIALSILFIFIAARGGAQRRPVNWGAAFFSSHNFLNQTALNGVYNLFHHAQIYWEERNNKAVYADYFTDATALGVIKGFNAYGQSRGEANPVSLPRETRPNVVVIFLESFAAKHIGALGSRQPLSPEFDKLAAKGIFFTSFYANGTRTTRGLAASLCSFPPLPGVNLTKKIEAQQQMPSAAAYLGRAGYKTLFFYGGDAQFEDMKGFYLNNGFENFYGYGDYPPARDKNPIGVYDQELFENVDSVLRQTKQPFFTAIMTLTNHGPFTLPPGWQDSESAGLPRELRTFKYSDWALGRFIEAAKQSPYYKNTVFLIMGDHSAYYSDFNRERFHIPFLIYSPLIKKPARISPVASQLDITPTILSLCGIQAKETETPFWGVSLFKNNRKHAAYVLDDPYFGLVTDKYFYRESFNGGWNIFSREGRLTENPAETKPLQDYSRAVLQTSRKLFFAGKAGSDWKK